ncbi:MAG: exodeoxyribonuclease III, partial [Spirochaetales bacterium]|nr:exodeoxyribonuclease III [Spirochaetales bacterium]
MIKIITWNVNGIRAAESKGLYKWMKDENPDILCLQETKANPEVLTTKFIEQPGYYSYFASAEKKGYSGVVTYSKEKPSSINILGIDEFDSEGRYLELEFKDFIVINCYFPNSQAEGKRIDYKVRFCESVQSRMEILRDMGKKVILCGDYNVAHKEIDLANPKSNVGNPGFLPEERAWMDRFVAAGFIDVFRFFDQSPGQYTWWSYRFNAR